MYKRPKCLGYAAYLTGFEAQKAALRAAAGQGAPVFVSLHISEEFSPGYPRRAAAMCDWLFENGFTILADVSKKTVVQFGEPDLCALAKTLHLRALRIDYGFTVPEICSLAAMLPVALNASTTTAEDAAKIAASGPLVMAMHNFYPRPETGLDDEFLLQSTRSLQAAGVRVLGFIPGNSALRGPIGEGLPTLERHRGLPPCTAFAELAVQFGLDEIYLGDPGITDAERTRIERFCRTGVLALPALLRPGYESLYEQVFTCRPDSPAWLVRFQESREYSCFGGAHAPEPAQPRPRGALTMDNDHYGRYAGELQLLRRDHPADVRVNVIGRLAPGCEGLGDCILRGEKFALVRE